MSTPLKLIAVIESANRGWVDRNTGEKPVPGDCFTAPWMIASETPGSWSPRYLGVSDLDGHLPRVIVLPTGQWWCIDQRAYKAPENYTAVDTPEDHERWANSGWHGEGWTVTGELPNISVTPSISVTGYHGFVTNGVLSDSV